jgi:phospholipase/carboxylesterase
MEEESADAVLPCLEIETRPAPTHAVIWLHGLGADGYDFEPLVEAIDVWRLPAIRFVFPHAPLRAITANNGYVMRAWYDIDTIDFTRRTDDAVSIRASSEQVEALIARENARGIPDERIVLAGFSQGGVIALHTALRHPRPLAAVLALSTYLALAGTLADEAHPANRDLPIFMAHGREDSVIPFALAETSADRLRAAGYPLTWHAYWAEHTISMPELRDIESWLRALLGE